ncbi:amino acid adenylation domain-containing protein [Lentzea sp. NPDC051208]|uniref:non-ribosomal peptide synthetase n=1 Tax=Lentzea sp. NPDC051208 TaxID=3154642 RepID=UPI003425685F
MSFAQRRLWFLDQLHPGSADYLLPVALRLRGPLDVGALAGALRSVAGRHEVLRTRFPAEDGDPVAVLEPASAVPFDVVDMTGRTESEVDAWVAAEASCPIDVGAAVPLRAVLGKIADDEHVLVVVVHHIAFDFGSWPVLTRELAAHYGELTGRGPADLAPLPTSYAEHARSHGERLAGERMDAGLAHWTGRLADLPPLRLPTDKPRPAEWTGAGAIGRFQVPADLLAEVDAFARRNKATRYMVLLAAFQALLARYSGQTDFAVGTPVTGRDRVATEALIGLFVNTIALRADVAGKPSFTELLGRVRAGVLADLRHADIPFDRVVTELAPARDLSRNPLFQVTFSLLAAGVAEVGLPGLEVTMRPSPPTGLPFDLVLDLIPVDGGLAGRVQYAVSLFDAESIDRIGADYPALLRALLTAPDTPVTDHTAVIPALPGRERARLLACGNDTAAPSPTGTVVELIAEQAARTPDLSAVRSHDGELTHAQLDAAANRLAHHLRGLGIGRGSVVGVHLDRGHRLPVAFLGVLKAGAAYVPLDPDYPTRRLEFFLADTGATALVTETALADVLSVGEAVPVLLDAHAEAIAAHPATPPEGGPTPDDLAYTIYTSGSTGLPKGVMIDHRGLAEFLVSMVDRPGLEQGTAVVGLTTASFDPSVLELYLPLLVGAHVVIASAEQARDPQRLAALIAEHTPRLLQATPVTLRMLLDSGWSPPSTLTVLAGGEKLPPELVRRLSADGARVWDLYGPTETTVWATTARVDAEGRVLDWAAKNNSTVFLLDADLEPVADGEVGEIYLGGAGTAVGYHNRPGATAERFLPDPFSPEPGARMYRTGDLGRRGPGAAVAILGRADHQVKIRGHRMEPGEIEAALLEHPGVRAAVVHPTPAPDGDLQLTAYLVGDPSGGEELRPFLLASLPDYMLPAAYVVLDELPKTANGKVDRLALPLPQVPAAVVKALPSTPDEKVVAGVWAEVLNTDAFGVHDSFFDVGGHSLLATRVAVRLRAALSVDVPVRALFDHSSVAALAAALPSFPRTTEATAAPVLRSRRRTAATPR